ncbi:hypothetical protein [Halochromatium roseum]|uniref:hypothetical protein n=1 Tax=Halochromatium roseum TaxID=391920 RepID=UPI001A92E7B7|nr:hypothetical protein [Halochromatium roseum]
MLEQIDANAVRIAAMDRKARINLVIKGAGGMDAALAVVRGQLEVFGRMVPEVEAETRRLARMN